MNQSDVLLRIQRVFDDTFLEEVHVTAELTAHDVEEWDSLLHISLILAIETEFNIRFRMGEVEATRNVGDLADLIVRRTGPK